VLGCPVEQESQPYLHTQHSQHCLRRLRHQPDQSRGTQELQVLLHMVEPSVRLFPLSSPASSHYTDDKHSSRSSSAIPGVSAAQLSKSCKCLLTGQGPTATTAQKVTTSSTKAAASSTAPACKKRRKVRRTVTVEVPAEATPSV